MNCRKCRAQIFNYRDGILSPRRKEDLDSHLAECPRCREEFGAEENLARSLPEAYRVATDSVIFDPDKAKFLGREIAFVSKGRSCAATQSAGKPHAFRWLAAGAGAAIILAVLLLGPFKPGRRRAFPTAAMERQLAQLRPDDLADPFQDWIEKRMIITVEDKSAGTTEKYLTDREGTIRRIVEQGRN